MEVVKNIENGILVGGQMLKDVRVADDQGMASSIEKRITKDNKQVKRNCNKVQYEY